MAQVTQIPDMEHLFFMRTVVMPNGLVWHIFNIPDVDTSH